MLILFAMSLFLLVGILAIAIDVGYLLSERRQLQAAADSGALAAAASLLNADPNVVEPGVAYAVGNADVAAGDVAVNRPPTSGRFAGDPNYIQVIVHKDVPKFFVGAIYSGQWAAEAVAVAGVSQERAGNYALITLDRHREPGIKLNGNTGVTVSGENASVMSNTSISGTNNSRLRADGTIDAHGDIEAGRDSFQARDVNPGRPQIEDPLAKMKVPPRGVGRSFPNCDDGCQLEPGHYRHQHLTVRGVATLRPGLYVFENVTIALQSTNARLQGTDVLVHFTGNSVFDPRNGEVELDGAERPIYQDMHPGIVFWFDHCGDLDMQGNAALRFSGIFYAPCSHVTMHGNPLDETVNGQMIVGTLDVRGTSDLHIRYHPWVIPDRSMVFLVE